MTVTVHKIKFVKIITVCGGPSDSLQASWIYLWHLWSSYWSRCPLHIPSGPKTFCAAGNNSVQQRQILLICCQQCSFARQLEWLCWCSVNHQHYRPNLAGPGCLWVERSTVKFTWLRSVSAVSRVKFFLPLVARPVGRLTIQKALLVLTCAGWTNFDQWVYAAVAKYFVYDPV